MPSNEGIYVTGMLGIFSTNVPDRFSVITYGIAFAKRLEENF